MNASYANNGYSYNTLGAGYGNYGGYGSNNVGVPGFGGNTSLGTLPNAFNVPGGSLFPQDSVMLSGNGSPNFNFGVQDVCHCQFGNGASQEAFVVPAGDQDNPFQDFNATSMELPNVNGQSPEQTLMALLSNLGFTPEMIQMLQGMGINLLDLVAQANGMEGMNGLQSGQDLILPTTMPANSETPSIVYMPAADTQTHGTHRAPRTPRTPRTPTSNGSNNGGGDKPAAAPRPQTLNDEARLAGFENGVPRFGKNGAPARF